MATVSDTAFSEAQKLFAQYQIPLSVNQYRQFCVYARLLSNESTIQNVTRVQKIDAIWSRHFLDSAYLLRYFDSSKEGTLLDLGTGGGFPGIPLAIMCPSFAITLLDSEERKLEFCQKVIKELGISTKCLYGRAEDLSHKAEYREQFDYVASRAVAQGSMLCELALPFLKVNGTFFALKGSGYDSTIERFSEAAASLHADEPDIDPYELEDVKKYLIRIHKTESTPLSFPRRFAKMKRSPL